MKNKVKNVRIHSVKYNFAMSVILKISQYVFSLITLPYITRTLGAIGNGKVSFAVSVVSYFSMLAQLGIPSYGIRECAKCRDDKDKLTRTVQELLAINVISALASYILLILCTLTIPKLQDEPILLAINAITIILNMLGVEWLYQALEQYQYITIRNISFKLVSVIGIFLLIHKPEDYIVYGALTVFSSCGSYILNFINCRKILNHRFYWGEYSIRRHLKPILTFFALTIAISIYTSMDTVMLGFIAGDEQVAFYSLSVKVKMILATTVSALGPVLLPRITYCINAGQMQKFGEYINKSLHFILLTSIPLTIFFIVMAQQTIAILGGEEYMTAVPCMQIITLAVIPLAIGNLAISQVLTPTGREKFTMYSTICGAIINFFSNLVLIPYMGAGGAALATVFAESVITCIQVRCAWKELRQAFRNMPYVEIIVANTLAVIGLLIFQRSIYIQQEFVEMVATCIVFFGIYVLGLILFKDSLLYQYGGRYVRRLRG